MSSIISENIDINLYNEKVIFGEWYNIKYRFHILRNNNFKKNFIFIINNIIIN